MRKVLRIVLPGGAFLVVALALVASRPEAFFRPLTSNYAIVLYAAGAIMAGAFHRSRVVAAMVALALVDYFRVAPTPGAPDPFDAVAAFLIGLVGVLALLRDRGITSRSALFQLACAGLVGGAAYLAFSSPEQLGPFWGVRLMPPELAEAARLPQATLMTSVVALAFALFGAYRWGGPVERALVWSEPLVLASAWPTLGPSESSFMLMCAGLLLAVSVLETSYFMAYRDELTGLPARRALMHDLGDISGTYTLAMVDVDHFKKFNDQHGHDVGDQVLKLVAKHLAAAPGGGKAYRYGGEEFTLVYPGRVADAALPYLESVRASVEKATFSLRAWNRPRKKPDTSKGKRKKKSPRKLSVTVSMGLADSSGRHDGVEDILKKADEALYKAKRGGRNRVAT